MLIHLVWRCNWWQTKRILEGKKTSVALKIENFRDGKLKFMK